MILAESSSLLSGSSVRAAAAPARLAIYYGYPSLVNGAHGDVQKAASVFSAYDVVVWGEGIEFPDKQPGRYPPGDPEEHQKATRILSAVRERSRGTRFYGYVCLGDLALPNGEKTSLTSGQLEERVRLWKQMGVAGIFLDEAGYDFPVVTRKRQNMAVGLIHELGLSAFVNAYFLDDLFSLEDKLPSANGAAKNPEHLPALLDKRDVFLLESFQVKNGSYEGVSDWQPRLTKALKYRRGYGPRIFVSTTTTDEEPFDAKKFNYAWWTALLYGLDGFSWGEPNFAALSNALPDHRCGLESALLAAFEPPAPVSSDGTLFWRKAGNHLVVADSTTHTVHRLASDGPLETKDVKRRLTSSRGDSLLSCTGGA